MDLKIYFFVPENDAFKISLEESHASFNGGKIQVKLENDILHSHFLYFLTDLHNLCFCLTGQLMNDKKMNTRLPSIIT